MSTIRGNTNSSAGKQYNAETINIEERLAPVPRGSAIQTLLTNIVDIEKAEKAELNTEDYKHYTIKGKIAFNEITLYNKFYDRYYDGYHIVEARLKVLELYGNAGIRQIIIDYIAKKYRLLTCQNLTPDMLIVNLDKQISEELESRYSSSLKVEDIGHVDYVIFHVFAKCGIFDKPPTDFIVN